MADPIIPAAFRVSFVFGQQAGPRSAGWTMNFWNSSPDLNVVLGAAANLAVTLQPLVGKQTLLLWYGARAVYSPPGVKGPRLARSVFISRAGGLPNQDALDSDFPTTALLLELSTVTGEAVRQTIRGIWDDNSKLGGWYTPVKNMAADVKALMAALSKAGSNWCLRTQDAGQAPKQIQGFDTTNAAVTCKLHGLVIGDIVKLGGKAIGITPRINGKWRVTNSQDADHFNIGDWPSDTEAPQQEGNFRSAYMQKYLLSNKPIVFDDTKNITSQATFVTKRNVGRPIKVLIGRRNRPK